MKKPSSCKYCAHRPKCNKTYLESLKDGAKHLCIYDKRKEIANEH